MSAEGSLWGELGELFDTDDGSLPEVVFDAPPRSALQPLFTFLMQRGRVNADRGGTLWDPAVEADIPITDVPDAGERVADGRVPSFHVVFNDIEVDGVTLPPLGAFFCEDEVALDYRMGDEWNPSVLAAFARLLGEMRELARGARLTARPDGGGPEHEHPPFESALDRYLFSPEASAHPAHDD